MSFWGRLLGSDDTVSKGFDLVDNAFYTDQEEAETALKKMSAKELILKAYEPFKLAQRYMMIIVGVPYVTAWVITFIASFFTDVTAQIAILDGKMGVVFLSIASFYFGGGLLEGAIKAVKHK